MASQRELPLGLSPRSRTDNLKLPQPLPSLRSLTDSPKPQPFLVAPSLLSYLMDNHKPRPVLPLPLLSLRSLMDSPKPQPIPAAQLSLRSLMDSRKLLPPRALALVLLPPPLFQERLSQPARPLSSLAALLQRERPLSSLAALPLALLLSSPAPPPAPLRPHPSPATVMLSRAQWA